MNDKTTLLLTLDVLYNTLHANCMESVNCGVIYAYLQSESCRQQAYVKTTYLGYSLSR